jgi:hypothetical protein
MSHGGGGGLKSAEKVSNNIFPCYHSWQVLSYGELAYSISKGIQLRF